MPTNVDTPVTCKFSAMLTVSKSEVPSTSKFPLASIFPENVASSATVKASTVVAPSTSKSPDMFNDVKVPREVTFGCAGV